ncbi:MAG: sigma 54-interacting transcriptional regulator [Planctomycetota bacterium]
MSEQASTILIVEDEQIVAVAIEGHLQRLGYQVVGTAASGEEACKKAAELDPDLVLMDVRIEGPMDGIEAAQRIRQSRDVPVVFLTAYSDVDTVERAKVVEPYGYIVKPFDARDLHTTIEMALHKGNADRRLRESHENMRTILDAQRHGTVMLDAHGRVRFASQAALRMAKASDREVVGHGLVDLLPLSREQATALEETCRRPQDERGKVALVLDDDGSHPRHLEIEIADDPRHDGGTILFLYDVSPLFHLRRQLDEHATFQKMIGKSKPMRQVFQTIQDVARVDSTVLIEGETGTGKELVARAIHQLGRRSHSPFVAINCAGLSDELAASQLFGHRRGSFTGAISDQQGLFEAAHGGTLFLDEIGDLSLRVQTALLRVLEENAVLPLGESAPRPVDVRVLTATHRDLVHEAAEQQFRYDLLYRIRVARVSLPALRQRREDLPILVRAFLADHRASTGKQVDAVSDDAMAVMMEYKWPGNVRELRNALEYAVIRARGSILQTEDLPPELLERRTGADQGDSGLDEVDQLRAALKRARGNRTRAAALLGISRATLYRRLGELGIEDEYR